MADAPESKAMLSERELAERWGVSVRTLQRRREAKDVPAYSRVGRKGGFGQGVRYRLEDIITYENEHRIESGNHAD